MVQADPCGSYYHIVGDGHYPYRMVPPSDVCWFINPMTTIVISAINHSEMGVMCTNLANELGHHLVGILIMARHP